MRCFEMNTKNAFDYLTGVKKFDIEQAKALALEGACEGIVLLENKNRALPLNTDEKIALFGRMQTHYLMLGTGSGGRVVPIETDNIYGALSRCGFCLDKETEEYYADFEINNPFDPGDGWTMPDSQKEPKLSESFVRSAGERNGTAVMIIARTAGESKDMSNARGGYYLSEEELHNLKLLRAHFKKLVILLNVCGVIDCSEINANSPDAVLMLWTGGMLGAAAAAKVLSGEVNPSGKLPDTMAVSRDSYPASGNFGKPERNIYKEDIYVGYRYFNTFAPDDIIYPFGYGLSYTEFDYFFIDIHRIDGKTKIRAVVSNLGSIAGKAVLQCYVSQPCGKLGKPRKVLAAFCKTKLLKGGESCTVNLEFSDYSISSYDDSGASGNRYCYVLEAGEYIVELGHDSINTFEACSFSVKADTVTKSVQSALAPVIPFDRMVNKCGIMTYEPAPLRVQRSEPVPAELPKTEKDGMTLADVADGKITVEELVSRFDDNDLINIVRGEGMSSPKVTPGTGAAFVGVTPSLKALGLPVLCCTDGPSGIRMMNDIRCVAYPAATCLASSWNTALVREMYNVCGNELASYNVDILLGPGTNIHRDVLCGRNFEYFSEDPYLSGKMAAAVCSGLDDAGVSGALKHFLANNQELDRYGADSVLSERAVREIYARPFEICVNESGIRSVMTSYNPVNGRWAASNYDLTVRLLRNDFGFDGFVMSDWWANVNGEDGKASVTNLREMVHAQNDVYMVTPDAAAREDNLPASLADGSLTRGELQKCAVDLVNFALISLSYLAERSGYGLRDLKSETERKEPFATLDVVNGKAFYKTDKAFKAIIRVSFVSDTSPLVQTNVALNISARNAGGFIVGGTEGKAVTDLREISLAEGDNEFVFSSESPLCKAIKLELF